MGWARALETLHLRAGGARAVRPGRSRSRAAARSQLHEQFENLVAAWRRGGDEMVAPVDGMAAERAADLGRPDVTDGTGRPRRVAESDAGPLAAFVDGCRRVYRAPAVWAGVFALT